MQRHVHGIESQNHSTVPTAENECPKCNLPSWGEHAHCSWHAEVKGKSLEELDFGLRENGMVVRNAFLEEADLSGVSLSWVGLEGANLVKADLVGAVLAGTRLGGADLRDANLSGAYLQGADLSNTHLSGANLCGADLSGAKLNRAGFSQRKDEGESCPGVDLSDANLSGATLNEANLRDADLSGADLSGADLSQATFYNADLSEAHLPGANLSGADFPSATFDGADLRQPVYAGTEGLDGDSHRVNLSEISLTGTQISGASPIQVIKAALRSSDELTRGEGADAAAVRAERGPKKTADLTKLLFETIMDVTLPSVQATAVRTFAALATENGLSVNPEQDSVFADLLRDGDELVRETVATDLTAVVVDQPDTCPKTVSALREALDDESRTVRVGAAKALAVIAHDRPDVLADLDVLLADLERLRDRTDQPEDEVEPAIRIARSARGKGETTAG